VLRTVGAVSSDDPTPVTGAAGGRRRGTGQRSGRRTRRLLAVALVAAVVVVGLVSAWQAYSAYRHLTAAQDRLPQLREDLVGGDRAELDETAQALRDDTAAAREALDGPQWDLLAALPGPGGDVAAAQAVTEVVDDLARDAFGELVAAAAVVDPQDLKPEKGRIPLAPIVAARPHVTTAAETVRAADARLATIDPDELTGRLQDPVEDLATQVADIRDVTAAVAKASRLLPSMLGQDGPRRYLVLVQNNAEPRALGGIVGSIILLEADGGRIELLRQRPASSFGDQGDPVVRLSQAERGLYGTQLGRFFQNVTNTPDFPRAAELARAMWREDTGRDVDGVLSVDPVTLELLLRSSGPVEVPGGRRLTGRNAAQTLLNQVYIDVADPQRQDAFFAVAASAIFEKVTGGNIDVLAAGEALAEAADQGRLFVWSADRQEQQTIEGTAVSGTLRGRSEGDPVVGVYLHDRTAAKIGYYEDLDVEVRPVDCGGNGTRQLDVTVTLTSKVPRDVASLPDYLTGGGHAVPVGHMRSDLAVYAPDGGLVTGVRSRGRKLLVTPHVHDGLHVAARTFHLAPGERVTVTYRVQTARPTRGAVRVRTTPGPAEDVFSVGNWAC
jgi:hypothetical protein